MTSNFYTQKILTVVLNYNDFEKKTDKCLQTLQGQTDISQDILVIDNHSNIDPSKRISAKYPDVSYLRNKSNLGVAGGRNLGIKYALDNNYDHLLFFDNDAEADSSMLKRLLSTMVRNDKIGLCGPKILELENRNKIYRAGCTHWKLTYLHSFSEIIRRIFRTFNLELPDTFDTIRGEGKNDCDRFNIERFIDFQLGAATLIRCSVFKETGRLDEQFNPYGSEDIDFCIRARKTGWKIAYVPKAVCWHPAMDHDPNNYNRCFQNTKNILILARKHLSISYFCFLFLPDFLLLTIPLMIIDSILKKMEQRRKAIIDALKWNFYDIKMRGIFLKNE